MIDIIIVDDDRWQAEFYAHQLTEAGHQVRHAAHALEAIELIDMRRPDMLVLDVLLPGTNGIALLHELQTHDDTMMLPVVIVSTLAPSLKDLASYGVTAVLDKATLEPGELERAVQKAIAREH